MTVQNTPANPSALGTRQTQLTPEESQRILAEQVRQAQLAAWREQMKQVAIRQDQFRTQGSDRRTAVDRRGDGRVGGRRYNDVIPSVDTARTQVSGGNTVTTPGGFRVGQNPQATSQQWQPLPDANRVTSPTALGAPSETDAPADDGSSGAVPFYSQVDPRWANSMRGQAYTIGAAGCAMTATAMALSAFTGEEVLPDELDGMLDANDGYSGDLIYWDVAAKSVDGNLGMEPGALSVDGVSNSLRAGRPVVAAVDWNGDGATDHWVTLTGEGVDDDGNPYFTANDPAVEAGGEGEFRLTPNGYGGLSGTSSNGLAYNTTGEAVFITGGEDRPPLVAGEGRLEALTSDTDEGSDDSAEMDPGSTSTGAPTSPGGTSSSTAAQGSAFAVPPAGLQFGDRGENVEQLQSFLVAMGYMSEAEKQSGPGIFGPLTHQALTSYQSRVGLPATGYYGELTQAAAQKAVDAKVVPQFAGTATATEPGGTADTAQAASPGEGTDDTRQTPSMGGGTLGAPSGTIPSDLQVAYGRGGSWEQVNQYDDVFAAEGARYGVDPAMLKAMAVIESGGQMIQNGNGSGAYGIMQIKPGIWGGQASALGYDLYTPEGQIGFAAAMLGGQVAGVSGSTPEERFLSTYYPTAGLDVPGEDGHTPRQYLQDIATLTGIINAAAPA